MHRNKSWLTLVRSDEERDADGATLYVFRGMLKGFLIYVGPITVLRRSITASTIRRGAAISGFVGVVRALDRFLKWTNVEEGSFRSTSFGAFLDRNHVNLPIHGLSGGIAAYIALKIDPSLLRSAFVFWCLVRGLRALLPRLPGASTAVMCLSASQILGAWIVSPEHHVKSYLKFLDRQGMKDGPHTNWALIASQNHCACVHPGQSHAWHFIDYFASGFPVALTVYIPLYLFLFTFSRRKDPRILLRNVLQSSTFLTMYCATAYLSGCIFYSWIWPWVKRYPPYHNTVGRASFMSHLWVSGLSTLIERPSRRPELAAYCATFALESLFRYYIDRGTITYRPGVLTLVICFSAFLMLHYHEKQPAVAMKWLCGVK